jgi:hypothetical protein
VIDLPPPALVHHVEAGDGSGLCTGTAQRPLRYPSPSGMRVRGGVTFSCSGNVDAVVAYATLTAAGRPR